MAFAPIWKDRIVTLDTASYADFEIHLGDITGDVIYSGRAYARPGSADVVARINDICAPYLGAIVPDLGTRFTPMQVSETFVTAVGGVAVDTITFYNDWSYDPDYVADPDVALSDPITGELDPRQWLLFSVLSGNANVDITIHFLDGTTATVSVPVAFSADFNNDFNGDFAQSDDPLRSGTAVLDLSLFTDIDYIEIPGYTLRMRRQACARYLLAYVNALGGWDTFILDGTTTLREALTRHTMEVLAINSDPLARGRKDYAIEIAPEWTLRTDFLTDEQSLKMRNLLDSVEVYLCDLTTGIWLPVVLTDQETPVKTYKGNGRVLNQYTFTAQLAQERLRR